jgi:hypothetical protein
MAVLSLASPLAGLLLLLLLARLETWLGDGGGERFRGPARVADDRPGTAARRMAERRGAGGCQGGRTLALDEGATPMTVHRHCHRASAPRWRGRPSPRRLEFTGQGLQTLRTAGFHLRGRA